MRNIIIVILIVISTTSLSAKRSSEFPDWSKKSHSDSVKPNYEKVFSSGEVKRIDLTIDSSEWDAMWSDLDDNFGANNHSPNVEFSPMWAKCSIRFEGIDWYNVGVRFKGNSSLTRAYTEGNKKLSMKLDFDEFEDLYPELNNQRFYGFKNLNLNSNFNDSSFIREMVASHIFSEFGLAVAQSVPCELYIDYGEGSQYYGLYTIVEEVDDTAIKNYFSDDSGNIYKPEERAGSFAEGRFDENELRIKNNKKKADYSDAKALYATLNSPDRTSDQQGWMAQLETVFDVDTFLKWLAVNSTIQNWDSYGSMAHNYYLYNNNGVLTWIPWDHNEAFQAGNRGSYNSPSQLGSIGDEWPLIKYIITVDEYRARFNGYIKEFVEEIFTPTKMSTLYDNYYTLLKESVYRELSGRSHIRYYKAFDEDIEAMKSHVTTRKAVVESYLENPSLVEKIEMMGPGGGGMMPGGDRGGMMGDPPPPMMMGGGMQSNIVEGEALPMERDEVEMLHDFMNREGRTPPNQRPF